MSIVIQSIADSGKYLVTCDSNEEYLMKQVPGGKLKTRAGQKQWEWPMTPFTMLNMVEEWQGNSVLIDKLFETSYPMVAELYYRDINALSTEASYFHITKPWDHQNRAFHFLYPLHSGALFADMRTGKTKVVLDLIRNRNHRKTLVVCPKSAMLSWRNEAFTHLGSDIKVSVLTGPIKDRIGWLRLQNKRTHNTHIFITNYESLARADFANELAEFKFHLIVADEAHKIKSPSGVISKTLFRLGKTVPYRLALTGTPAADKPLDIFGIYRFLDESMFGTFADMKRRYAITESRSNRTGQRWEEIVGYVRQEELHERMYRVAFRVTESILSLPDRLDVTVPVELSNENAKAYIRMKNDSIVQIAESVATGANILSRMMRLQQITSGYIGDEDNESKPIRIGSDKSEALVDILENLPDSEPIVVFCRFHEDLEQIKMCASLTNREYNELSGRVNQLEEWRSATGGEVIGVQIAAGSAGIDLSRSSSVIYYSKTFSLAEYKQSRSRVVKANKAKNITYWHLVAEYGGKSTIDAVIEEALAAKKSTTDYLVDWLRQGGQNE